MPAVTLPRNSPTKERSHMILSDHVQIGQAWSLYSRLHVLACIMPIGVYIYICIMSCIFVGMYICVITYYMLYIHICVCVRRICSCLKGYKAPEACAGSCQRPPALWTLRASAWCKQRWRPPLTVDRGPKKSQKRYIVYSIWHRVCSIWYMV